MRVRKLIQNFALLLTLTAPVAALAQNSSLNTFSPYTLYGIGDLYTPGNAYIRSMGGAGVALSSPTMINTLNPASNSAAPQKTFIFNVGLEGGNYFLKSNETKSSFNTFNIRDVSMRFPLTKKLGMGLSLTPYSSVGYRLSKGELTSDDDWQTYSLSGEGGISQFRAGLGYQIHKRLSVGADWVYYHGNTTRTTSSVITSIISSTSYLATTYSLTESVSRMSANFGAQWDAIYTKKHILTVGATYQMAMKLNSKVRKFVPSNIIGNNTTGDLMGIKDESYRSDFKLPSNLTLGAFYHKQKFSVGADYSFQGWGGTNKAYQSDGMTFTDSHWIKVGGQFTPNAGDVRHALNRLTYRAGVRYGNHYMKFSGEDIIDKAVTFGVGIPVRTAGLSNINLGVEYGQRGTLNQNLVREEYLKFSIGLSLFGDHWFLKHLYE